MLDKEITLLNAVRDLDQVALVTVFDLYAPIIYKYAMRLSGDPAEADDIVGDAFAELLKQLKKGRGPTDNLRSYLFQIAYHKIVDHTRSRQHEIGLDDLSSMSSGEQLAVQQENREQLIDLTTIIQNHLSEDQYHVVSLRFIEDFSLKETAQIMGKTVNHIKVIQNRAITKIWQVLDRQL